MLTHDRITEALNDLDALFRAGASFADLLASHGIDRAAAYAKADEIAANTPGGLSPRNAFVLALLINARAHHPCGPPRLRRHPRPRQRHY